MEAGEQAAFPDRLGPVASHGIDHVVAGDPFGHQATDRLGRILQIGIHQHDRIAPRVAQPGLHGGLMPEVSGQVDHADISETLGQAVEDLRRLVGRAVVDEDDLLARAAGEHRTVDAALQLFEHPGFVEDRQHDADQCFFEWWTGHGISRLLEGDESETVNRRVQ